ncbi:hypothetical protein NIE88_03640 [Sporolactobacillus shoreicorticis]|uniref:Uncharacterized protein n=1 Tax=Sporolactobacillus shoreicorticis TaxID=1923877 RepID=A0ABW5RXS1_9BACL|nr:hypothetical protein [Sporolactobacillus shoreicorticis]MCO7124867.1 hypothetical protein [Sporolactobacillus shoreicorticis]
MENFDLIDDQTIRVRTGGVFGSIESYRCYSTGELEGIQLSDKIMIVTQIGELVPFYTETARRKNKYSIEFYKDAAIKAVSLENQQEIYTPIGDFPAEFVTFYNTGELNRFFPLDGKISGFWTEDDERSLQTPLTFDLGFTKFKAFINCVALWKDGGIRSITLFPGEVINIKTALGEIAARNGFSLYPSGELESLEPAGPAIVHTPIGLMTIFDPDALGITADSNSLVFDKKGRVIKLITSENRIDVRNEEGYLEKIEPKLVVNQLDGETMVRKGIAICFNYERDQVVMNNGDGECCFSLSNSGFTIETVENPYWTCSPSQCAGCSMATFCFKS